MLKSGFWFSQELAESEIKTIRSKFSLKFSNLFYMPKGRKYIGNSMDNVCIVHCCNLLHFYYIAVIISVPMSRERAAIRAAILWCHKCKACSPHRDSL